MSPTQIAELTDWQIQMIYVRPAVERQQQYGKPKSEKSNKLPSRAEFVRMAMMSDGGTPAKWHKVYDELLVAK